MKILNCALSTAFAMLIATPVWADDAPSQQPVTPMPSLRTVEVGIPEKGYEILVNVAMGGSLLKNADLDRIWMVWEKEEKAKAEAATPAERRRLAFERYGLIARPGGDETGLPLGFVDDGKGGLATNCFSCHGGKVAGKVIPGLENSHTDLTALATDVRKLGALDRGTDPETLKEMPMPYGLVANFTKGRTNATQFAPFLGSMRNEHLDMIGPRNPGHVANNDMLPPAWWQYKKKEMIYCDAFAPKSHRTLMQFTMSPTNSGADIRGWEDNFVHIQAYIQNLQSPKYPFAVDAKLAAKGRESFEQSCARCHGTYGPEGKYPNKVIPIAEIGTDPVRFGAVSRNGRERYNKSWFSDYGQHPVNVESKGYIAPLLDGVWATAPYFHNGAVPTVADIFNPADRPHIWKRDENGYDEKKLGLVYERFEKVPEGLNDRQKRTYFDSTISSLSVAGHPFADEDLNADEKVAVIEYLKTL